MKFISVLLVCLIATCLTAQDIRLEPLADLPMRTSNNAVVEGFANGKAYIYSFGGIDETKDHSGIHLRSFRLDVENNVWEELAPLPDDRGKIASSASRVGNIIYIIGGYHVAANGTEKSSSKVHRFDITTNTYLTDGADIPTAIDDQVQVVRGDLIYVVTGWSDNRNVPFVQVYNTVTDTWDRANFLPNNENYLVFGASGTIVKDTIFYYGGAGGFVFNPSAILRKGVISADDPLRIEWSIISPMGTPTSYRTASSNFSGQPYWFGGSEGSYNFDGIAYNGSGGVDPAGTIQKLDTETGLWQTWEVDLPMDLRSVGELSAREKVIVGGMTSGQEVSNQVWKVTIDGISSTRTIDELDLTIFPNPTSDLLTVSTEFMIKEYSILDNQGRLLFHNEVDPKNAIELDVSELPNLTYYLKLKGEDQNIRISPFVKN